MSRIIVSAATTAFLAMTVIPVHASEQENKEVVERMVAAINGRDWDALDEVVAADLERHCAATPGVEVHSREQFEAFLLRDLEACPDAQQEIEQILAEGDLVAARLIYRGTQTGPMGPFPPSGKTLELPYISILRVAEGKVAEIWVEWDNMSALTQLGHLPPASGEATGPDGSARPSAETLKAIARRWFDDVINARDLDAIDATYSADYAYHGPGGLELEGRDAARAFATQILAASDDRHAVVEQQIVSGNLVTTRFVSTGHHTGVYRGIEPTGAEWTTEGIVISRIVDGKIVEDWEVIQSSGL